MSRLTTLLVLAALSLLPVGCAFLDAPSQMPLTAYLFRYHRSDFHIGWKTMPSNRDLIVEVMLKNVRFSRVSNLTLDVSLKKGDKVLAEKAASLVGDLAEGQYGKLTAKLRNVSLSPGDQLHFSVKYTGTEGRTTRKLETEFTVDAVSGVIDENQSSPD